jgi:antitoxin (DNA-binding transcriptional repressor) of toxin-antitoxin stability system
MTTIDLNTEQQWDDIFRRVEAGEVLRVTRGDREVALIQPAEVVAEDEAYLDALAVLGAKQLAESLPPDEFKEWSKDIEKTGAE